MPLTLSRLKTKLSDVRTPISISASVGLLLKDFDKVMLLSIGVASFLLDDDCNAYSR